MKIAAEDNLIKNYLNLYWLRPETVVWRTLDAIMLSKIKFSKPILDMGCGDGTFSFTLFDGKIALDYDIFLQIKNTKNFFQGRDLYNQKRISKPQITKKPKLTIDVGLDHKQNLLDQAKKLNFYNELYLHDLNKPTNFEDAKFSTIFSNTFYWIENLDGLFKEAYRILKDNGNLVLLLPDKNFKHNLLYFLYLEKGYQWAKILDRGIYSNVKHAYSFLHWKSIFQKHGFTIIKHHNYLSKNLVRFHNVGLRPYSPYLIDMSNNVDKNKRSKIKKRLITEISPIIKSYLQYEKTITNNACFHLLF